MPQLQLYLNENEDDYIKEVQRVYDIGSKIDAIKKVIELRAENESLDELATYEEAEKAE